MKDDFYEVALSFVIELSITALHSIEVKISHLIVIEKRGRKEDKQLDDHFLAH